MSEEKKKPAAEPAETEAPETPAQEAAAEQEAPVNEPQAPAAEPDPVQAELEQTKAQLAAKEEQYLRLLAEYDNYRKRTAKEKESAWRSATGEAAKAFLPVYDNLERALKQQTADEAYRKGVEMTMTQLKKVLSDLGLEEIPALGEPFDANLHSAVQHVEDSELGENIVKEVYQTGFKLGDTVIRYAMVVVAN